MYKLSDELIKLMLDTAVPDPHFNYRRSKYDPDLILSAAFKIDITEVDHLKEIQVWMENIASSSISTIEDLYCTVSPLIGIYPIKHSNINFDITDGFKSDASFKVQAVDSHCSNEFKKLAFYSASEFYLKDIVDTTITGQSVGEHQPTEETVNNNGQQDNDFTVREIKKYQVLELMNKIENDINTLRLLITNE